MRVKVLLIALLTLCIAGSGSARYLDGENTKTPAGPEAVLVLDGSPVHNVGQLQMHVPNWGMLGSWPGSGLPFSDAPSAQWPAGSGVEYLFAGGLWVGAIHNGVPAVSTAMYAFEFRPTADPVDVVYRSAEGAAGGARYPSMGADDDGDGAVDEDPLDGHDNDGDGSVDEDFAAISDQMFSCWYTDDQPIITEIYPDHHPLHLMVRERSYQWSHPDYDDFVGVDYEITNTGDDVLEDVYVGIFFDPDVGRRTTPNYWEDDGADLATVDVPGLGSYDFAYGFDVNGDGGVATGNFGVVVLDHPTDASGATAPMSVGLSTFAVFNGSDPFESGGDPTNDFERYELMSAETIEPSPSIPRDFRVLVSVGPFASLAPGETIPFSIALVATPGDGTFANVAGAATVYEGATFGGRQVHWWLPGQAPPATAAQLHCMPRTVNLRAENAALRAHVTLPDGYRCGDVDPASVRLNGMVPGAVSAMTGERKFVAEFSRKSIIEMGASGDMDAEVTFMAGGQPFTGSDRVRVIGAHGPQQTSGEPGALRSGNFPNPFNPTTRISFELPNASDVALDIYSADGRLVRRLASGSYPAGAHDVLWQGRDDAGRSVASGIYFYRLRAGNDVVTRKMVLLK